MDTRGIAIIYHPQEGHTVEVADHIASRVRACGIPADVFECRQAPTQLRDYRGLMVGGSIRLGRHHRELEQWVRARKDDLNHLPNAFFSVGLHASQDDSRRTRALDAVSHFIAETGWHPDLVSLVGGGIAYTRYGFIKRRLLRKLGADFKDAGDATSDHGHVDWAALDQFTDDFIAHVQPPPVPHTSYRDHSSGN